MTNKTDQTIEHLGLRASVLAVASCLALLAAPAATQAAGLGKVVVQSALGQPLRAEIELTATREELADMKAQLATPDAFKQAGIDYATTLLGIRFSLDKRANGQAIIRLNSDKPINDPFVDMLLELNWPTGRLVREYTFLLDPPETAAKAAPPVASATARSAAPSRAPAKIDDETRSRAAARVRSDGEAPGAVAAKPAAKPAGAAGAAGATDSASGQETRPVRRGDTLNKIASASKPEGVTLDQMLVGLLRANQDAFDGGNMNRLKAGRILTIPDRSTLEAVSAGEARRIVVAQSSDWNAYRSKLAGIAAQSPGRESTAGQEAAGKITAKVDDPAVVAAESKDQLKVSPTEKASGKAGAADKRGEEDLIAKEKALDDAKQRLVALEKNVADLQKLVELKNQNLADLQKQSAAPSAAAEPAKPVAAAAAPKAEPAIAPLVDKAAADKPAETKTPEPVAKTEEVKADAAAPAKTDGEPPAKPAAPAKPKPKPVAPPPPPQEEPGLLDALLDNPLLLAGGGGVLALLAALFVVRRRRASQGEAPLSLGNTLSQQFSSLTANSIFRSTGGQSVDTSHGPAQTDFSQAGPGSIDTDEVDPVAEADVYMAYGRDAQAEEILIEARQKDPARHAIPLKLLEIYANRKDPKQFEALATELYSETGGSGADWEKAAAIGQKLDPDNPLYSVAEAPVTIAPLPPETLEDATAQVADEAPVLAEPQFNQTISMPGELSQLAERASAAAAILPGEEASVADEPPLAVPDLTSLDFDLDAVDDKAAALPESAVAEPVAPEFAMPDEAAEAAEVAEVAEVAAATAEAPLDFDLDSAVPTVAEPDADLGLDFELPELPSLEQSVPLAQAAEEVDADELAGLDFDLGVEPAAAVTPAEPSPSVAGEGTSDEDAGLDFDVKLTDSTFLGQAMPEAAAFDMSAIDLNLEAPEPERVAPAAPATPPAATAEDVAAAGTAEGGGDSSFDEQQSATVVNSAFEALQQETQISPSSLADFDRDAEADSSAFASVADSGLADEDFELVQGRTNVNPQLGDEVEPEAGAEPVSSEDVTTKLDLAKAYEEMGDYEGARELLQEVLLEGDAAQRAKAQFILAKIGE